MPSLIRIAIVEDHDALRNSFVEHLTEEGFDVFGAACAEDLDDFFIKHQAQLLILDVNLPGESGLSIAKRYRNSHPSIHIIMLTVKTEPMDRIIGYQSGADVYLAKPVSAEELTAAVMSVQRRHTLTGNNPGLPRFDNVRRVLCANHTTLKLSPVEAALLKGLIEAPERLLEYWRLLELIDKDVNDKSKFALANYISRLNKKMIRIGLPEPTIIVQWKVGYRLAVDMQIQP